MSVRAAATYKKAGGTAWFYVLEGVRSMLAKALCP